MPNKSDRPVTGRQKVQVTESRLLLNPGASKRLREMSRGKVQSSGTPALAADATENAMLMGLGPAAAELKRARNMMDNKIKEIMDLYPAGKRNRLFQLRFGSVENLKKIEINAAFGLLGLNAHQVRIRLLADLDYYGNRVQRQAKRKPPC